MKAPSYYEHIVAARDAICSGFPNIFGSKASLSQIH